MDLEKRWKKKVSAGTNAAKVKSEGQDMGSLMMMEEVVVPSSRVGAWL